MGNASPKRWGSQRPPGGWNFTQKVEEIEALQVQSTIFSKTLNFLFSKIQMVLVRTRTQ